MNILICGDSFKSITGLNEVALNIMRYFKSKDHNVAYCNIVGDLCYKEDTDKFDVDVFE